MLGGIATSKTFGLSLSKPLYRCCSGGEEGQGFEELSPSGSWMMRKSRSLSPNARRRS